MKPETLIRIRAVKELVRFSDPSNSNVASLKITKSLVATAYNQFQNHEMQKKQEKNANEAKKDS